MKNMAFKYFPVDSSFFSPQLKAYFIASTTNRVGKTILFQKSVLSVPMAIGIAGKSKNPAKTRTYASLTAG